MCSRRYFIVFLSFSVLLLYTFRFFILYSVVYSYVFYRRNVWRLFIAITDHVIHDVKQPNLSQQIFLLIRFVSFGGRSILWKWLNVEINNEKIVLFHMYITKCSGLPIPIRFNGLRQCILTPFYVVCNYLTPNASHIWCALSHTAHRLAIHILFSVCFSYKCHYPCGK